MREEREARDFEKKFLSWRKIKVLRKKITRADYLGRLAVDLRWLDHREKVTLGLSPVTGWTNRLKITRVLFKWLALPWASFVLAVPILSDGDFSAFWFGELLRLAVFAFVGLLQ